MIPFHLPRQARRTWLLGVLLSLSIPAAGVLFVSTAAVAPAVAADVAKDTEQEAQALKQRVETHLAAKLSEIKGVTVNAFYIGNKEFAVSLTGKLESDDDIARVIKSVREILPQHVLLYPQRLTPKTPEPPDPGPDGSEKVKLFFQRSATKFVTLLRAIPEFETLKIESFSEDEIILHGKPNLRRQARQIIAAIDLPFPGVTMEMWGVQISSSKPSRMAEVLRDVRQEIDRARQGVRSTLRNMQAHAAAIPVEARFSDVFWL